ncbi:MAG: endonuclease/exonuclease/phosphatase family protein [Gemmatimonadales bacterium]|nr:endonuclease/exonuclease/phosphatase family protein [Gemmatimonadales bacterium]
MRRSLLGLVALAAALTGTLASCASTGGGSAAPGAELRVVTYNIRHGRGMDDSVDLARTARVLRALAPDVVGLQEVDHRVRRSGGVDQAAALGGMLGMAHAFGAFMEYQGGQYGLAILSRFPVVRATPVRLPDGNEPRVALVAELRLPDGRSVAVVNVHFDWVDDDGFRFAQARALTSVLDTLSLPYILLGDFNDLPGSRTLALFHQRAAELAKPSDDRFTFSSTSPAREIDFIFVSPADAWIAGAVRAITEPVASDHRPVLATVGLRR